MNIIQDLSTDHSQEGGNAENVRINDLNKRMSELFKESFLQILVKSED